MKRSRKDNTNQVNKFFKDKNQEQPIPAVSQEKRGSDSGHTPTPWKVAFPAIVETYGIPIAHVYVDSDTRKHLGDKHEDAAFIVRAVNAHEELVKAGQRCLMALAANGAPNCEAAKEMKQALARAEGKE